MIRTRDRKSEHVALLLRSRMADGQYPAGSFLPSERALAVEFGVARNTIRSSLALLEDDGRVSRQPSGRGTLVLDRLGSGLVGIVPLILPGGGRGGGMQLSPEGSALLAGVLDACSGSDIRFQIQGFPAGDTRGLVELVRRDAASGLLFIECHNASLLDELRSEGIPHVVVNQEHDVPGPATRVDFWATGRKAADLLVSLGHQRLAVLSGPRDHHMYRKMLAGFRGRAAESEIYLAPEQVAHVPTCSEAARKAALEILQGDERPTAIFCERDMRAYGAYLAARELGLRVPEDLSLVGYDNITWPGEGRMLLTTFREPAHELGTAAIEMLGEYIRAGEAPEDVVIAPEMLQRCSTARVGAIEAERDGRC